ncbi:hypothetical protein D3C73_1127320 [compost metagenome]
MLSVTETAYWLVLSTTDKILLIESPLALTRDIPVSSSSSPLFDLSTASLISNCIFLIISAIFVVASLLLSDNSFIDLATTAKPLPYSPALAASILAFNDNMLV